MINVSVIIAIYNTKPEYLKECINSVLNQTEKNLELILVNDGSQEYIETICKEYCEEDSRVIYLRQNNYGCSIARNNGLNIAKGDYILFADHDDTMEADYLELLLKKIKAHNADFCLMSWFKNCKIRNIGAFITFAALIKHQFLIENSDVRFPANIQPCEDGIFSHMLLALTNNGVIAENAVYHWRNYEEQTTYVTDRNTKKILNDIPKWFEILENFYLKHSFLKIKGEHLLRFIENEPYGLRFAKMKFSYQEKRKLFNLIHDFSYKYNLCEYINNSFSKDFVEFMLANSYEKFLLIQLIKNLFSVKVSKDKRHKIITILGIKVQIKYKGIFHD